MDLLATVGVDFPDKERRTCDVAPSISMAKVRGDGEGISCITPTSRHYLSWRGRLLTGLEALVNFQGIDHGLNNETAIVFQSLLQDLAGNAFHVGQCACMYIAILMAFAEAWAAKNAKAAAAEAEPQGRGSSSSSTEPDPLGSLDSLWT